MGVLGAVMRRNLGPEDVSPLIAACFVECEDRQFWRHVGIDGAAVARALLVNLRSAKIRQGGSTLTQQLVKNLFLSRMNRWVRKFPEAVLALLLERATTKEKILRAYLDCAFFGGRTYGLGEASRRYFGKPAAELRESEAATLASMLRAPNYYLTDQGRPYLLRRATRLLARLQSIGVLDRPVSPRLPKRHRPVRAARRRRLLERRSLVALAGSEVAREAKRYGRVPTKLRLTAELGLQHRIHGVLAGSGLDGGPASVLAMRVRDRSVIGAASLPYGYPFASAGRCQPGSTMKPFILVAALEQGFKLSDCFRSEEVVLKLPGGGRWRVRNHNQQYLGDVDLCTALAASDNAVFAQLVLRLPLGHVTDVLSRFGLGLGRISPAVALGAVGSGVRPLDLLNAYASIADGGLYRVPNILAGMTSSTDDRSVPVDGSARRVTTTAIAQGVAEALRLAAKTGPAAMGGEDLHAKTGTSATDQLVCAYREDVAALVWLGRPHGVHEVDKGNTPTMLLSRMASLLFT